MSLRIEQAQALGASESCPNRQIDLRPVANHGIQSSQQAYYVTCPRYPQSIKFLSEYDIKYEPLRATAALTIGCRTCPLAKDEQGVLRRTGLVEVLHSRVADACGKLFIEQHFPQAALQSYVAVKERLREITGFETTTQALGKGGLYFLGAEADHIDGMYQQQAQFTLMAIDAARNRSAHSMPTPIFDLRAAEHLAFTQISVSSQAMTFLDNTEIRKAS